MLRVTVKGLFAHKPRFALTALAVMLGVAFLSGTLVLNDTIKRTFDNLFADVNRGTDAVARSKEKIDTQFGTVRQRVSASLLTVVEQVDGVAREGGKPVVNGQVQLYAQLVDKHGEPIGTPGRGAPTLGFIWDPFRRLSAWRLTDERGRSRPPRADDEVVIDKGSADKAGFHTGDTVKVLTQSAPATYRIAGIARFGTADSPAGASVTLFTRQRAQVITGAFNQFDSISVAARPGISQAELVQRIRRAIPEPNVEVLTGAKLTEEQQTDIEKNLSFFNTALLVFALVALFVCCFIILNTFSIIVEQRVREMALLRAIGASGRQVMSSVLGESLVVGALASVVGLGLGLLLSAGLKALLAGFGIDIPAGGTVVNTRTIVVALVVGMGVTLFSAIFPSRRASRIPPVAAIRAVSIDRAAHSAVRVTVGGLVTVVGVMALLVGLFVSNSITLVGGGAFAVFVGVFLLGPVIARPVARTLGWPIEELKGATGALARENAARNPKRASATAAALMVGVALVGFITIFASSTKRSISVAIDRAFRADYVITTKGGGFGGGGFSPDLAQRLRQLPQVGVATGLRFNGFEIDGKGRFLGAADPTAIRSLFDFQPRAGDFEQLGVGQIAVSKSVADDHHWKVGDTVKGKFPVGGRHDLRIGAIYRLGSEKGLTDYFISADAYNTLYPDRLDSQVYAKLRPGVSRAAGRHAIETVVRRYPNADLKDQTGFKQSQEGQVDQVVNLIYALLALAVIIAGIGIANTLALSIVERTRELGLLRAVGMTRNQLKSTVRWEAVIIAMFGTVLGLGIGVFFGWAVVRSLRSQGISEFAPPGLQLIVIVVVAALLAVGFAYFPARRAAKLDVLRAIETE